VVFAVSRDYEPVPGQWYENVEEEESFRVLSVDEDSERLEIEYLDGDIEEIDLETWREMDLERIEEPEGWSESDDEDTDDDEDWEEEDERTRTTTTSTRTRTTSTTSGMNIDSRRRR
jgi:hypothetical protein